MSKRWFLFTTVPTHEETSSSAHFLQEFALKLLMLLGLDFQTLKDNMGPWGIAANK